MPSDAKKRDAARKKEAAKKRNQKIVTVAKNDEDVGPTTNGTSTTNGATVELTEEGNMPAEQLVFLNNFQFHTYLTCVHTAIIFVF